MYEQRLKLLNPAYLTDSEKSPGLLLLGRTKKQPSVPFSISNVSESVPDRVGWNHLPTQRQQSIVRDV